MFRGLSLGGFSTGGIAFNPSTDIPDLSGKTIFVTGGNSGLGAESVTQLAAHSPTHIYLAARTRSTAEFTISTIHSHHPNVKITIIELDLSSFSSIRKAVETFTSESDRLDILLLNAGIAFNGPGLTADGYELQFGTNHQGHALLTQLLLPTLLSTARHTPSPPRVVVVASYGHNLAPTGGVVFDQLKTEMRGSTPFARYGQSKLANILFARVLARKYPQLLVAAVHPGAVLTPVTRGFQEAHPWLTHALLPPVSLFLTSVQKGARNQLWACTADGVESGAYYEPVAKDGTMTAEAKDDALAEELWKWTERELRDAGGAGWPQAG